MPRNWKYDAKLMAVVGRKGRGKSTLQRQILRDFPAQYKIVFDHKGEFCTQLPAQRCTSYAHCRKALEQTQSCVFDPRPMFKGQIEEAFEDFCRKMFPVMQALKGPHLFVFDEVGLLAPDNWSLFKKHPLHEIVSDGRSWEIDVLLAGQAPTDMTLKFRNQVTHWFVMDLGCEEAAEPLRQYGYTWEAVKGLERGEFIAYNHNTGELHPKEKTTPEKKS
jgi:hypothetical protein